MVSGNRSCATLDPPWDIAVAKKKKERIPPSRQMNIRVPDDLFKQIEETADTMGLDPTNFIRMLIKENLASYQRRAERIRQGHSE